MITFRSFSANVMVVLSQALIAAVHESASGVSAQARLKADLTVRDFDVRFRGRAAIAENSPLTCGG
jgi:hypothetical protein